MDDYREYVNAVADLADGKEIIQNKTPAHAGVIIAALFNKAVSQVRIVSGKLDGLAYGSDEVIAAAAAFLSRPDTQLKIIVESAVGFDNCKFLARLRDLGFLTAVGGRLTIARAAGAVPFHFLLADENHYRFEADPTKCEAIAQFGTPSLLELRNAFDIIAADAVPFVPA